MDHIIEVKDLCKTYVVNKQQNNVLRNVNFTVDEGEMVGIMGPSGSGKSTLLYTVSGMDSVTAGEVIFNGKNLAALSSDQLAQVRLTEMGFVFQQMYMMRNLDLADNILLPAMQTAKTKAEREEKIRRCRELMHKLGISEVSGSGIGEVSGGQLQRACICRAIINSPKVLFADEPTGALNRAASDEVMEELGHINMEGTTVMMVTHDVKVAARCTRVLYIVDGNIRGEYSLGKMDNISDLRSRERILNNWLLEQGW